MRLVGQFSPSPILIFPPVACGQCTRYSRIGSGMQMEKKSQTKFAPWQKLQPQRLGGQQLQYATQDAILHATQYATQYAIQYVAQHVTQYATQYAIQYAIRHFTQYAIQYAT